MVTYSVLGRVDLSLAWFPHGFELRQYFDYIGGVPNKIVQYFYHV